MIPQNSTQPACSTAIIWPMSPIIAAMTLLNSSQKDVLLSFIPRYHLQIDPMKKTTAIIVAALTLAAAVFLACTTSSKPVIFITGATSAICIGVLFLALKNNR